MLKKPVTVSWLVRVNIIFTGLLFHCDTEMKCHLTAMKTSKSWFVNGTLPLRTDIKELLTSAIVINCY